MLAVKGAFVIAVLDICRESLPAILDAKKEEYKNCGPFEVPQRPPRVQVLDDVDNLVDDPAQAPVKADGTRGPTGESQPETAANTSAAPNNETKKPDNAVEDGDGSLIILFTCPPNTTASAQSTVATEFFNQLNLRADHIEGAVQLPEALITNF